MKPTDITKVLTLAKNAREAGRIFNPLFAGDAGIGKSQICQAWVKEQQKTDPEFGFLDLRLAYFEGPDFVGLPEKEVINGNKRTTNILPEFWPEQGTRGLLLIEEPNRANSSVMNCLMQLTTDRKVHNYPLPDGWIIAGCINDGVNYDVNTMDSALKNRFVIYNVSYDHKTFISFMKAREWNPHIVSFVESGVWTFKTPDELGEKGTYISPRNFEQMNTAEMSGLGSDSDLHFTTSVAILGPNVGKDYYKFRFEQTPVLAKDLVDNEKAAIKKLKGYCKDDTYKGDLVNATVTSVIEAFPETLGIEPILKVAKVIPKDLAARMLKDISGKHSNLLGSHEHPELLTLSKMLEKDPELKQAIVGGLREAKKKETKKDKEDLDI